MTTPTIGHVRANAGADTAITLFVRDAGGRVNLTTPPVPVLSFALRRLGDSVPLARLPATGDALGRVTVTITASQVRQTLHPGAYAYRLTADGRHVQDGVLEVAA